MSCRPPPALSGLLGCGGSSRWASHHSSKLACQSQLLLPPVKCLASSFCSSVCLPACLSVCLSACLSVCQHWLRAAPKAKLVDPVRLQRSVLYQLLVFLQGFLPTLLEDVPDMAVKFAVFETLKPLYARLTGGRPVRGCSSSLFRIACLAMLHRLDRMRLVGLPAHRLCTSPTTVCTS